MGFQLPTSTGDSRISEPSTVWNSERTLKGVLSHIYFHHLLLGIYIGRPFSPCPWRFASSIVWRNLGGRALGAKEISGRKGGGKDLFLDLCQAFILTIPGIIDMGVSENSGTPQIINSNRVFPYKPSILGYPYFSKPPCTLQDTIDYISHLKPESQSKSIDSKEPEM